MYEELRRVEDVILGGKAFDGGSISANSVCLSFRGEVDWPKGGKIQDGGFRRVEGNSKQLCFACII